MQKHIGHGDKITHVGLGIPHGLTRNVLFPIVQLWG